MKYVDINRIINKLEREKCYNALVSFKTRSFKSRRSLSKVWLRVPYKFGVDFDHNYMILKRNGFGYTSVNINNIEHLFVLDYKEIL